jgi:hypothetical protein
MMETSCPVDCNVAFFTVQARSSFHAAARADPAEFEEPVKHRAIVAHIVFSLLSHVCIHIVWGDLLQEFNVFVGVKLCHLGRHRRLGALSKGQSKSREALSAAEGKLT